MITLKRAAKHAEAIIFVAIISYNNNKNMHHNSKNLLYIPEVIYIFLRFKNQKS